MPHRHAPLTELGRLRLAQCIVDDGWPIARAAERFQVSRPTATRWAQRYREQGRAGMADRSSRPHKSPNRTPQPIVRKIVHLRWKQRLGPVAIAAKVGIEPRGGHPGRKLAEELRSRGDG
ncbi:MAG: transposase [Frankiales bacterium]|nr:transposase [Frankiales bacterium]